MQLASKTPDNAVSSALSGGELTKPNSPFLTRGTEFLSTLFGGQLSSVLGSLGGQSGLRAGAMSTLLALGGQTVLGFLGSRVRSGNLTAAGLGSFLQKESANLQGALPAGFGDLLASRDGAGAAKAATHRVETNPVVAQTVQEEKKRSILPWLLGLLALLLIIGFFWYRSRSHEQPPVADNQQAAAPAPVAPIPVASPLGDFVDKKLPDGTVLKVPERGVEGKLLAFVQDPNQKPDKTSWFDFDRLLFNTGAATLQPQSEEQLHNIAAILKAYPATHLTIGGYTDNTGNAAANLKLSQQRAESVTAELEQLGVAKDRLRAKGYGEEHPVGDNSTDAGRALNRRISMLVTAK